MADDVISLTDAVEHQEQTLRAIAKTMQTDMPDHHKLSAIAGVFEDCEPGIWAAAQVAAERDGT